MGMLRRGSRKGVWDKLVVMCIWLEKGWEGLRWRRIRWWGGFCWRDMRWMIWLVGVFLLRVRRRMSNMGV